MAAATSPLLVESKQNIAALSFVRALEGEIMLPLDHAIKMPDPVDYILIEHELLERYLNDLHHACVYDNLDSQRDDNEKKASRQGRLPSFLSRIVDLAAKHFDHEEAIMLSRPHVTEDSEYFRIHRQAHVDLTQRMQAMVNKCLSLDKQSNTAETYRQFYVELTGLFEEHARLFDDPFIQSIKT